jgi:predicted transcriptional regulator
MLWDDVGFALRSKQRKELLLLLKTEKTPSQLAKNLKSSLSNVSLKLADLEKRNLIYCLNPNEKKGRIYSLTKKGKQIVKKIEQMER